MSAKKNEGVEIESNDKTIKMLSHILFRFTAEMMPTETPNSAATIVPPMANLSVYGYLAMISSMTGVLVRIDVPKSPCKALLMNL